VRSCNPVTVRAGVSFSIKNPAAVRAAQNHAARMVTAVSNETRQALRTIIARGVADGVAPRPLAKIIRQSVGINQRQAAALMNARKAWTAAGLTGEALEAATVKYADKLVRARAIAIARTESIEAANAGQMAAWKEAVTEGLLQPARTFRVWSMGDADTCPICMDLDGQEVPLEGGMFITLDGEQLAGPPAHPNCECSQHLRFIN